MTKSTDSSDGSSSAAGVLGAVVAMWINESTAAAVVRRGSGVTGDCSVRVWPGVLGVNSGT